MPVLNAYEPDFNEMSEKLFKLPSALSRMEKTGVVSYEQVCEIGTVGMGCPDERIKPGYPVVTSPRSVWQFNRSFTGCQASWRCLFEGTNQKGRNPSIDELCEKINNRGSRI